MSKKPLALVLLTLAILLAAWWLDFDRFLDPGYLGAELGRLQRLVAADYARASLIFFVLYATLASLSVPGAAIVFTLSSGALFGLLWGTVLVALASSIGGTVACFLSRHLLREFVERKFPYAVDRINQGIGEDGAYYLFGLRLVPVFPYFVINTVLGVTRLPLRTFYWVTLFGMLPTTMLFVNAGTQLARVENLHDVLSPRVTGSLVLLGLFPLVAKKALTAVLAWHRRRP